MHFTHEHQELQRNLKRFIDSDINPYVDEWEAAEMFPAKQLFKKMGELGFLGIAKPTEFGGLGLDYSYAMAMAETLGHIHCGGVPMAIGVQTDMATPALARFGSDELRAQFLAPAISGDAVACVGVSEPSAGSDVASIKTTARKDGDDYIINGSKMWITNSPIADVFVVWAKLPNDNGEDEIRGFILEKGWKGLTAPAIHGKVGLRTSITGEIVLDEVFVPEDNLMPGVRGLKGPFTCLNSARYGIAWGALGAAEACWHIARQYVLDRKQFGRPLAANQLVQKKLADMQTEITLGLQGCLRLGRMKDEGTAAVEITSIMKRNSCGKSLDIARVARDMLGGNGISDEFGVIRHVVNLEVVNTYEGTHDIHALILGRAQTGIQAFF